MVRCVPFVTASVILGVASGAHVPSSKAAPDKAVQGLRERRTSSYKVAYCNFIRCPGAYTAIENADEVECDNGSCEVSQCCEAFCSLYGCPTNYVPVYGAEHILCPTSGCTDKLCCEFGGHH